LFDPPALFVAPPLFEPPPPLLDFFPAFLVAIG
jgi:hypothetical protein